MKYSLGNITLSLAFFIRSYCIIDNNIHFVIMNSSSNLSTTLYDSLQPDTVRKQDMGYKEEMYGSY